MTRGDLACWEANITAVWAEELLRERGGSLSADQYYRCLLLSGVDPVKAQRLRARRQLDELRARE